MMLHLVTFLNQSSIGHCRRCRDIIQCDAIVTVLWPRIAILNFPFYLEETGTYPYLRHKNQIHQQRERKNKKALVLTQRLLSNSKI